eukprot:gene348-10011_t
MEQCLVVKGEIEVAVPASHAYSYLRDEKKRREWDGMLIDVEVIEEMDDGSDALLHYVMHNRNPQQRMKSDDFVMLVSRRPAREKSEPFTIAYRSVTLDSLPPKPEYNRAEVIYINQLTKEVYEYVKGALKGVSGIHEKRSEKLINRLLNTYKGEDTQF